MNLNKVILIGRISQQPNINQSKSGFSYTRFNIAISRDYQGNNCLLYTSDAADDNSRV